MKRTIGRLLLVTFLVSVPLATPTHAAGELGLSRDGRTWLSSIDAPLFERPVRWVPGDSASARFFVRNQGGAAADLTVDVISSISGRLMDSNDLRITAQGGGGTWASVRDGGTHRLLSTPDLSAGAVVPIAVTVALDADTANVAQLRSTSFRLRVTLTEAAAGGGVAPDDRGLLPDTGAPATWIAAVGALLVAAGLAAVARRRDRAEVSLDV